MRAGPGVDVDRAVLAARSAVIMVSTPLGTALGGPMVATLGGTWTLVASGVATLLLAGAGALFWREPNQTEWLRGEDSSLRPSD